MIEENKMEENLINELIKIGLTKNEALIYIYLLTSGPKSVKEISKDTLINRTEVYSILKKLENKEIVYKIYNKKNIFNVVSINKLIDILNLKKINEIMLLSKKKFELQKLLEKIGKLKSYNEEEEKLVLLKGEKQYFLTMKELIINSRKEILLTIPKEEIPKLDFYGILDELSYLEKKGVKCKIVTNLDLEDNNEFKFKYIKILKEYPKSLLNILIIDDRNVLFSLKIEEENLGFLSSSREFINLMRDLFNLLWKFSLPLSLLKLDEIEELVSF